MSPLKNAQKDYRNLLLSLQNNQMNVKNLKQMFERKGTIKEEQLKEEPTIRPKAVTQQVVKPEIVFSYGRQAQPTEIVPQKLEKQKIEQPRVSVKNNKFFMEQLNKKLGRQSHNNPKEDVKTHPVEEKATPPRQIEPIKKEQIKPIMPEPFRLPKPPKKFTSEMIHPQQQRQPVKLPQPESAVVRPVSLDFKKIDSSELTMDDIMTGMDRGDSFNNELNARYGINEKYPSRPREQSLFRDHRPDKAEEGQKTGTFSQMLQNMLSSLKGKKTKSEPVPVVAQSVQSKKVTYKIEYDQSYKTQIAKRNRIDFVLKVIFGRRQFQNIGLDREKPSQVILAQQSQQEFEKNYKILSKPVSEQIFVEKEKSRVEKQIVLEEIVKKKHEQNEQTISSTIKRPSQVSNQFLNELSLKLLKKSVDSSKIMVPEETPIKESSPPPRRQTSKIVPEEIAKPIALMVPRYKKKAKAKKNFDDF